MSWLEHLRDGLAKTRAVLGDRIAQALGKSSTEFLEDLEAALIQSDVGVATTQRILQQLAKRRDTTNPVARVAGLREIMVDLLGPPSPLRVDPPPAAVLVLGVNGVGKTTTIGKLAYRLHYEGRSVLLAAADTFRAAAIERRPLSPPGCCRYLSGRCDRPTGGLGPAGGLRAGQPQARSRSGCRRL